MSWICYEIRRELNSRETYRRILHKLGYYDYQHGLIHRHLKQSGGWDSHLEKCRNFILKAAEYYKPGRITVLGSGWLLDFPLAELLDATDSINLIDIIHPPEVVKQVSSLKKVMLSEEDITGGLIEEVWNSTRKTGLFRKLKTLGDIQIPRYTFKEDPGLLVSLNILSQLHVLPVRFLERKAEVSVDEFSRFRTAIQEKHLELLGRYKSVLITDTSEIFTDNSGNDSDVRSVLAEIPEGRVREEWKWDFDLKHTDYYKKRSVMKVTAILY